MDKKLICGTVAAGMLLVTSAIGAHSAQSVPAAVNLDTTAAIETALKEVPGTVHKTELERENGRMIYEIEIVTADGQEMEVEIDAETGAILKIEADDDSYGGNSHGSAG